jgi:hypothetical protein
MSVAQLIEQVGQERFPPVFSMLLIPVVVMPVLIVITLALLLRAARHSSGPIDDLVQASTFEPDPATSWAVVDLHALAVAHF